MKIQSGVSNLFICIVLLSAQVIQAQKPVRQRAFEKRINTEEASSIRGNLRISAESGYPLAVYNPNFAVNPAAPEVMARQYLQANMDLFGLKPADLQNLRLHAVRESAAGTVVRLRQFWKNVPVYGAEITITISPQHKVSFVMNSFRYKVDLANTTPVLSAEKARQTVLDYLNVQGKIIQERNDLIIFQHEQKAGLYYRVNITAETPQGDWEAYVDAKTGAFLKIEDIACYHHTPGRGEPEKSAPPFLIGGTGNVFRPDPLSSATATYGTGGYTDGTDANSTDLTSQLQSVTLQDITFDGTNYKLAGPWAVIVDSEAPNKGLFTQPTSTWAFNRSDDAFEAVNCYYHIDLAMRHLNVTLGLAINPYQYTGGVRFDPSGLSGADNSHYLGGSGQLAFGEGGVDDGEDADVIWHELGHGLHDWFTSGGLSQVNGLSEGCGDYWAASYSRATGNWTSGQAPYNWTFNWDGHNPFWAGRITNYTAVYPGGLVGAIHTDGQIWATAMMQVWDAIGRNKSDKAFWSGLSMTNSSANQNDAANAVFQAAQNLGYAYSELLQMRTIFVNRGYTMPPLPNVIFVDDTASGANNGTSWTNAYTQFQSALDASADGAEIWVAAGTYIPTKDGSGNANPSDPRTKTFYINGKNLKIYGGFNGNENSVAARPWPLAASIFSGEIGAAGNADNIYSVFYIAGLNSTSVMDGMIIQGGNASSSYDRGGGMQMNNCSDNLLNQITFQNNTATYGGGGIFFNCTTTLTNCKFIGNNCGSAGGGFFNLNADAKLYNCTFINNTGGFGAGMWAQSNTMTAINCSFSGNQTAAGTNSAVATLTNCIVWGNSSNFNFNFAPATVTYSIVQGGYTGTGNLNQNPLFVSATDLRLQSCSPAIDSGSDGANTTTEDVDTNPRFFQAVPGGAQIDRGAYEYQSTVPAPAAVCKSSVTANLNSAGSVTVNASSIDNSSSGCGLDFTVGGNASVTYSCANIGANPVVLTVTDLHGRTSTCSSSITVSDVTPPSVTCKNASVNLNAAGSATITTADVYNTGSDNCGVVNQVSVTPNSFTCANTGANTVTLTVNDGKGNNNTCTATVTVSDVTPPTVVCKNASVNLNAAGAASITTADVFQSGSDNCGVVNQVSVTPNSFTCANTGANTVTLTVNDGKGNNNTCTATVTVSDVTPPTVVCKNASVNLNAAGAASITTADVFQSGSDNCGVVNQVSVTPNSFTCTNTGTNTVTLTVNDGKGNNNTCTATVTVSDVTPPTVVCKNASVNLNAAGAASITTADVFQSGSDNCGVVNQVSVTPNSFTCANTGANTVTLTVNDGKGNNNTCTATVTVSDVTPPTVVCKNASVNLNAAGAASITTADVFQSGSDNCGVVNQASVTPNSFTCANLGVNTVTFTANDGHSNTATCTATVTVSDVTPPTITCKNASVNLSAAGTASITTADVYNTGSDNCGTVNQASVTPSSFTCANLGVNTVTFTANDGHSNTATCTATVTVSDVTPPTITCKNASVNLSAAGTASITTADVYNTGSDNCGTVNQASVTPNSFTCSNLGVNTVTFTANDGHSNTATCTATVTVSDVTPPTITCKNASVNLSAAGTASITTADVYNTGSDNCGTVNQASVTPNSFTCSNLGVNTVTFTANDGHSNTATCTATVTVSDVTPPTITCKNASVNLSAAGTASITTADVYNTGSDNCGTVNQASVTPNSFTCANLGVNTVTFTANDGHSNTATCTATVTVSDVTPPTITCKNASVNLSAAGTASITTADVYNTGSDNCGTVNQASVTPNSFTCANLGANTVTFTANDGHSNTSTCTATVTVSDVTPPTITCKNASVNLSAAGTASITTATVFNTGSDNCGVVNQVSVTPNSFTCANLGANTVTFTANDGHSNTATCTATVTIVDATPPTVTCKNTSVNLSATGTASITTADVFLSGSDNCGTVNQVSVTPNSFTCANLGVNTVTFTANDGHSNTATCTATVTVVDATPPKIVCQAATIQLNAAGQATLTPAQVNGGSTDNCTITNLSVAPSSFTCSNLGANTVTLTGTDQSGNIGTCTATVTVADQIAPVALCKSASVSLGSNGTYTIPPALINNGSSDNCSVNLSVIPAVVTCANIGISTITLRATDNSGNSSTCTALVTVRDISGPNALCKNPTVFLDDLGHASITVADVDNGSNDPCGVASKSININQFNCSNIASTSPVTLTVKDIYNNTSTCLSYVTVKDNRVPTAVCQDVSVNLASNGKVTVYGANLAGNSFDNCSVWSYSPIAKIYTTANLGANNLTITVKDWSGNAATCVSVVTVLPYNNNSNANDDRNNEAENARLDLRLYPNPTAGEAVLAFELPEDQEFNLQVVDMTGRLVVDQKQDGVQGENNTLLESNNWPSGVYLIRVESGGVQAQKRLVVVGK